MGILNELTSSIPGIDEAMCLGYIMKIVNQLDFSCVVFDTAPTGHTLRLLNFPQLLGKGLEKMISLKEKFSGILNSVLYILTFSSVILWEILRKCSIGYFTP
jgi:arsenite-transporting ATPase